MPKKSSEYNKLVLEHYRHPKNFGTIKSPTHKAEKINQLCGDEIKVYLEIKDNKIKDLGYEARGCALSIAAASVLSEKIKGQKTAVVKKLTSNDIEKLLSAKISEARIPCITLAFDALGQALAKGV